ncbi:VCBS repeat-containing protein [Streptomyces mobaraensis NBRC 13819 = DSM 40847]|uniref:N-acetylmuramoyl-L-alanine amidase n=1 Tax=Streptomyces mobaraensis (strain ATCC 29032 / DSM 40847 / JCM 4168 / NBRC 13819 / NCIMB 11159 / IPCR 16-22) TaxID=1223523 RepID=M3C558_STRM1|nr:FG-GAP-like repeat-containing protein [Streptomyces mobaraensis]EME99105.1 N-acetylmuramoyl-L-alanine amidase [Streptomyces mobaraensis NBRC 13819 = DSM 40847]QTT76187.1 VCBS repeat-containing protein [Streptomyces mobaraensis NBRC 13819 = DSM 40847]
MAHIPGRKGRALPRLVTTAIAVTLVGTTAGTALADGPAEQFSGALPGTRSAEVAAGKPTGAAPVLLVVAVDKSAVRSFVPDGKGGLRSLGSSRSDKDWERTKAVTFVDHNRNGKLDGMYVLVDNGDVFHQSPGSHAAKVARGFGGYDTFFTPGELGGTYGSDILTRDKQGVLWVHQADGKLGRDYAKLAPRKRVGGGWGQFTAITGRGDLTGDGRTDIVARDKSGTLWLYKGTGDINKPFASRTKVGGGWNQFTKLVATGDVNGDGHADLLAVDGKGALWLYKGTGKASSPYQSRVKIDGSGWNQYRLVF